MLLVSRGLFVVAGILMGTAAASVGGDWIGIVLLGGVGVVFAGTAFLPARFLMGSVTTGQGRKMRRHRLFLAALLLTVMAIVQLLSGDVTMAMAALAAVIGVLATALNNVARHEAERD
ncbi:hypothetical protein DSC45_35180 [Streptomyces sp. YIM 130001]|uniref:hypothetical protein n=1 Tax=Streptomyces sp. YIM 130001 TaxID=2259644 RepID=UPI000E64F857|nr:hypothetical protein [Streptomyces sp. YIM 130001]RII06863.1 hypothetical protein DSC45_35180 [Streptomyces sp. YIM 130001]